MQAFRSMARPQAYLCTHVVDTASNLAQVHEPSHARAPNVLGIGERANADKVFSLHGLMLLRAG
jgi:hypothetical protein